MATQEQAFAIEHLTLVYEDLTSEQEDSVLKVLGYVAELEAQVVQLQAGVSEMKNEIEQDAELTAERLVQVDEDEDLFDPINQAVIRTMYSGTAFLLHGYAGDIVHLPAGYYIAKVKPAA